MVFSSTIFLVYFLPIFLIALFLTPQRFRKYILLFFSLVFYAWGAPKFVFFIVASCIVDYFFSQKIYNGKKFYLVVSLLLNVSLLLYFKYANFFIDNYNSLADLLGIDLIVWKEVVLPIGISFFTFQKISYVVDVYRSENPPIRNFIDYLLYIVLFPQLIAGPIVRYVEIKEQILNWNIKGKHKQRLQGAYMFMIGLSKKILIANVLAGVVLQLGNLGVDQLNTIEVWLYILAYTFQIYFDFSGYSDMAIGLGKIIGFDFPQNFMFPYLSESITQFWQRWHITLGAWMKDYLYIPLGGNKKGKARTLFNLFIVFLISGLWHGASWNFLLWGAFHGAFLVLERLFLLKVLQRIPSLFRICYTFFIVIFGWVLFSNDLWDSGMIYRKMFSMDFSGFIIDLSQQQITVGIVAVLFSFFAFSSPFQSKVISFESNLSTQNISIQIPLFIILLFLTCWSVSEIISSGFNPFIYYRF